MGFRGRMKSAEHGHATPTHASQNEQQYANEHCEIGFYHLSNLIIFAIFVIYLCDMEHHQDASFTFTA